MRKIEDAAWNYSPGTLDRIVQQRLDFISGARYVLDQLTSEAAVELLACEFDAEGGITGEARHRSEFVLVAVRKEIEGE